MPKRMLRAISGSCLSLDDHDMDMPRMVARKHVLGSGQDLFDEHGYPVQPKPRTMTKVFSGSALDLNDGDSEAATPVATPADLTGTVGGPEQSFTAVLDRVAVGRGATPARPMVLVIGGAGYVAGHVIEQLLRAGHDVRCTLVSARDRERVEDLYTLDPAARHQLSVVEANIFSDVSLKAAMQGCRYIVHCGVPASKDADVVSNHTKAVHALFDAIRALPPRTVERVVLTGSHVSVHHPTDPPPVAGAFTEESWNQTVTAANDPLNFARVSFEREAWRLQKMNRCGVELVVILPAAVLGPSRTAEASDALRTVCELATAPAYRPHANMYFNFVDVRDVATAHVAALTAPQAAGQRYIVVGSSMTLSEVAASIRAQFPHLKPSVTTAPTALTLLVAPLVHRVSFSELWRTLGVRRPLDGSKAQRDLGLTLTPMDATVRDTITDLIERGNLPGADVTVAEPRSLGVPLLVTGLVTAALGVAAWRLAKSSR